MQQQRFFTSFFKADSRPATSRRDFLRTAAAGGLVLGAGTTLTGCYFGGVEFLHGVASGDPLTDRVILWTRVSPGADMMANIEKAEAELRKKPDAKWVEKLRELKIIPLKWEMALDEQFTQVIRVGVLLAEPERDYTVKADVTGLRPDQTYYYRFTGRDAQSPVGRTKTLPMGSTAQQVKLAVFSCSNYPAGFFNVYADAAKQQGLDAFVHLGDYIYEYARDGYASERAAELGRLSEPQLEIVTLADYRTRHAQYKTAPDLQALHASVPCIAVWDDHELTNDAWKDGAENHQPATEGAWAARKAAAIAAYYEWMPVRAPEPRRPERIYRSFEFGDLVSLHMLDTRVAGRDLQLNYNNYTTAARLVDTAKLAADVNNPVRQLMGAEQTAWLQQQMARSTATWQVLGQQVLMGRMDIPSSILFSQTSVSNYAALASKAQTAPGSLTAEELAILQAPWVPYNLDAWDGYANARETVFGFARDLNKNLISLAGDTHNAWASNLADAQGVAVGVEFATSSVTSPGFETFFPTENPQTLARGLEALIGPLAYTDSSQRGYMIVTATATECRADWRYVDTIYNRSFTASTQQSLRVLPGTAQRTLATI
jgi:alkaline phosphatase D